MTLRKFAWPFSFYFLIFSLAPNPLVVLVRATAQWL